jgi:hypothetical protein
MFCVLFNFTVSHISPQGHLKLPCGPIRKGPHWWETNPYREECSMGASMQPIRHCMGGTVCRASTPYWRGHNTGDIGQEVCAGQKVLTSVRTKGSPFSLVRFPLTFCVLLFLRTRCPEAFPAKLGSKSDEAAKRCRRVGRRSLGQGCPRCQAGYFTSLLIPKISAHCPASLGPLVPPFLGERVLLGRTQGEL